jgi:hypothetical protein
MPGSASGPLLQCQAKQGSEVAGMHCRPPVGAVAGVANDALFLCLPDEDLKETGLVG